MKSRKESTRMGKIVVIGSGTIGTGITAIFVAAGHDVVLLGRQ